VALLAAHFVDQPLTAIVLFLLVTLVLADASRPQSLHWLCLFAAAALCTHLGHTIAASSRHDVSLRIINTPLVVGLMLVGAGLLHPSVRQLYVSGTAPTSRPLLVRLLITTTTLVVPAVALALSEPKSTEDRIVRAASASVLALAVTARVVQLARANERAQVELVRMVGTDSLTKLPSRELIVEYIAKALSDSWRTELRPTVLFIDVDRFRTINDSLGHAVGDAVLCTIATRLISVVPERAFVGRMSGDEFVVVDPGTRNQGEALQLAELVLQSFREPMSLRQGDVFVTASIGLAIANTTSTTKAEELLRQADTAMYRAKDAGRNRIAMFDDSMLERVTRRLEMETALYRALERRELRLYHQPTIDLTAGEVEGFEALMRWERADGTLVSPAEFIPVAEETGIIVPIGAWALLEALTHLREWIEQGVCSPTATVSVNVSPRQLHDPNFLSVVDEALRRSGMTAHHLWLEVTESVMITEPTMAKGTLDALGRMGVRVAVDDFGTGYSSLSLLQQFPIHRIKIDRAFVNGLAEDEGARSLVRTIIGMADSLGLDLVAEGVENIAQLRTLHEMGCVKVQGFLISRPVPFDAVRSTVGALDGISVWSMLRSGRATPSPRVV
jgi:diguanylate cyclase (GGDEF)-like protein